MPDAQGNYLGDQATVMPDNTQALLHFSNVFAQKEQQRQAEKAARAKAELDRRITLQKYLGDKLSNKEFQTNSTYQGIVNSGLEEISTNAIKMLKDRPEDQVYAYLNQALPSVREKANKANELDKNLALQAADFKAKSPDADLPALISAARVKASYGDDGKLKDLETGVDPSHPYLQEAYDANPENFYSPDAISKAWGGLLSKDKPKDVNDIASYDAKQNLTNVPFKGKIPSFAAVVKDVNGKVVWDENTGKPKVDIPGSHNYILDGKEFQDDQGKKVRVVDDLTFENFYHGAIRGDIEKQVKKVLSNGEFAPDSDYADMLRKKLLYDKLVDKATKSSSFLNTEGKSFERKNALTRLVISKEALGLSKSRLSLSEEALQMRKDGKFQNAGDITDDFLSEVDSKYGQDLEVEDGSVKTKVPGRFWGTNERSTPTYSVRRIIPVTADQHDLDLVAGKANTVGERPTKPKEYKLRDGSTVLGYEYDPSTGDATGAEGTKISKDRVQEGFIKYIGGVSETKKISGAGHRSEPATKTKKPSSKISGIEEGGLN